MIDEPTNHLDEAGRALTARYLRGLRRGFLLVSHDRAFLDGCVDHILALNPAGQELIQGNFSVWFREKEARDRREEAQNEKLKGEIRRLEQAARAHRELVQPGGAEQVRQRELRVEGGPGLCGPQVRQNDEALQEPGKPAAQRHSGEIRPC